MIKNRIVLIDSFALIFRAFYGVPPSLTYKGKPINAAYGFASAILSAIKDLQPEYLVAAFDLPKPTLRHQEYVEYKATRKPMPDDLVPQVPICKEILKALNIPMYAVEGYEGEDIIATIIKGLGNSEQGLEKQKLPATHYPLSTGLEAIIVTGDMDTLQLIDGVAKVYSMARGINQAIMYDKDMVKAKYGVTTEQFVDFKALKGDPSDNIPGVPGIGEKTAANLIQRFNSLEELYSVISNPNINEGEKSQEKKRSLAAFEMTDNIKNLSKELKISEKVLRLLTENKDQAFLSQKLSKIYDNVPLEFNLPDARVHDYDLKTAIDLFRKLGFRSLITRLPEVHKIEEKQQSLF